MSEERVDPVVLRGKAGDFETEVGQPLNRAATLLEGAPRAVAFPAFSMVGGFLAAAHAEALNYTFADLDTKANLMSEFRSALEATASIWEQAEEASTVETGD